ncbi:glycoside hydrolase family 20 zincin-like fold domain-containing protein, partial [Chryseobacterium sp.]|uniref:glycoside hydrolase family 20 zincin-like fold domain-containing protein n=1 Tax=Chryseobacterium sp. TaxID=1871047 RepID=UPI0023F53E0B
MIRTFLVFFVLISNVIFAQNKLNVIPYPQKVQLLQGEFLIPKSFVLNGNLPKEETDYFKKRIGSQLKFQYAQKGDDIHLTNSIISPVSGGEAEQKKEYYSIEISPKQIHIESYT